MNNKTKIILVIGIVIIAALAGVLIYLYKNDNHKVNKVVSEGIIIEKKDDTNYETKILHNYTEYNSFLEKYNISDLVFLTNSSFNNNDYIVDFILYDDDLVVSNIDLQLDTSNKSLDGITYYCNKKVTNSNRYLIYFIPTDKDTFDSINELKKEFLLDNN